MSSSSEIKTNQLSMITGKHLESAQKSFCWEAHNGCWSFGKCFYDPFLFRSRSTHKLVCEAGWKFCSCLPSERKWHVVEMILPVEFQHVTVDYRLNWKCSWKNILNLMREKLKIIKIRIKRIRQYEHIFYTLIRKTYRNTCPLWRELVCISTKLVLLLGKF